MVRRERIFLIMEFMHSNGSIVIEPHSGIWNTSYVDALRAGLTTKEARAKAYADEAQYRTEHPSPYIVDTL